MLLSHPETERFMLKTPRNREIYAQNPSKQGGIPCFMPETGRNPLLYARNRENMAHSQLETGRIWHIPSSKQGGIHSDVHLEVPHPDVHLEVPHRVYHRGYEGGFKPGYTTVCEREALNPGIPPCVREWHIPGIPPCV